MSPIVSFKNKAPFRTISGRDYCVWSYAIDLDTTTPISQVGLGFSALLDIQDPAQFPDVPELSSTRLEKSLAAINQFVFAKLSAAHVGTLDILVVAPCAEDAFTPLVLATVDPDGARAAPNFRLSAESSDNSTQVLRGPSAAPLGDGTAGTSVVKPGILPYASELFGVYQPLLGWRSALAQSRLSDATAHRVATATRLLVSTEPLTAEKPIGTLQGRAALNRIGSDVGQKLAIHVADSRAGAGTGAPAPSEWHSLLTAAHGSVLSSITRNVISGLQSTEAAMMAARSSHARTTSTASAQTPTSSAASANVAHEAATATLLHYLGQNAPGVLTQIFHPAAAAWQRALAGAIWFSDNHPAKAAFLSPIGILHRFREYFFQLGTFLGPPVGHVWLSPGGTVELVEVNTRHTLVDLTTEQSTETVQKTELSSTDKDELSDAVKTDASS
jgi:hypothetical protein